MRYIFAVLFLFAFTSPVHATCNKTATVTATPTTVNVEVIENGGETSSTFDIYLVNPDDTGCAARQFCYYPSFVSNQGGPSLGDSLLTIEPTGDWHCTGLLPGDSLHQTLTITQDYLTPAHRYRVYNLFRSGPNYSYPVNGGVTVYYNRVDAWGSSCD